MTNSNQSKDPEAPELKTLGAKDLVGNAANRWLAKNRSLVLRQTPVWAQALVALLVTLGTAGFLAAIFFRIDEVVTVSGRLVALSGSTQVKNPVGGKIKEVFFKDGAFVKKGDLLLRFDTRQAQSEKETYSRLIKIEQNDLKNSFEILQKQADLLRQKLATSTEIVAQMEMLLKQGAYQRLQFLEQQDRVFELKTQLSNVDLQMTQLRLESQKSIGQMENSVKQAELQIQYQNVYAPVDGVVFDPKASVDGVIGGGEVILTLVPKGDLKASVWVANKDIGFVKTGQSAKVRVDAFPFTSYGELEGTVSSIGADALPPDQTYSFYRFPVKMSLDRSYLESDGVKIKLRSGMSVTANLKLREKRVISLLSDLLVDQTESIKTIRQQ